MPFERQLLLYMFVAPVLIGVTYPGCFLCGGLLVALLPEVWRRKRLRTWTAYVLLVALVAGAFLLVLLGPAQAQRSELMTRCWERQFPDWERPSAVPVWAVLSTLDVVRYCYAPTGQVLAGIALLGGVCLWRQGHKGIVTLCVVPILLALAAACVGGYPYGGVRVLAYAAPGLAILIGAGLAPLFAGLGTAPQKKSLENELPSGVALAPRADTFLGALTQPRSPMCHPFFRAAATAALAGLLLAPAALTAYRLVVPWQRADCATAAAYVLAQRQPGDAITCNHWEYYYYFQELGPVLQPMLGVDRQPGDRLWMVLTGGDPKHRQKIVRALPPCDWRILEQRDFTDTTVFLLYRDPELGAVLSRVQRVVQFSHPVGFATKS
jgi:hypothetical protein